MDHRPGAVINFYRNISFQLCSHVGVSVFPYRFLFLPPLYDQFCPLLAFRLLWLRCFAPDCCIFIFFGRWCRCWRSSKQG